MASINLGITVHHWSQLIVDKLGFDGNNSGVDFWQDVSLVMEDLVVAFWMDGTDCFEWFV